MNVIIFPLIAGFLRIDSIAPATNNHSPIPTPRPAAPTAIPAPIAAHDDAVAGSSPMICKAIISP